MAESERREWERLEQRETVWELERREWELDSEQREIVWEQEPVVLGGSARRRVAMEWLEAASAGRVSSLFARVLLSPVCLLWVISI